MKTIIFDFDGTIVDSFEVFLESFQATINRHDQLSADDIANLRTLTIREIIKNLGVKKWQMPLLRLRGKRELTLRRDRVKPFNGMPEVIHALSEQYTLYIASTNSVENICYTLDKHDLSECFADISGDIGISGKARALKKIIKDHGVHAAQCVYVGDETRDIEAARKAGMRSVAVSWGFNDVSALRSYAPDDIADTPQTLLAAIEAL